ncbi:hypothetical protein HOY80DRAFT_939020 [Tuber brumale]|nr:hypothetical protein HOY80DRAFT_939020 [Tuber brumale]
MVAINRGREWFRVLTAGRSLVPPSCLCLSTFLLLFCAASSKVVYWFLLVVVSFFPFIHFFMLIFCGIFKISWFS